jgi:hypothetical protein
MEYRTGLSLLFGCCLIRCDVVREMADDQDDELDPLSAS